MLRRSRRPGKRSKVKDHHPVPVGLLLLFAFSSCSSGPEEKYFAGTIQLYNEPGTDPECERSNESFPQGSKYDLLDANHEKVGSAEIGDVWQKGNAAFDEICWVLLHVRSSQTAVASIDGLDATEIKLVDNPNARTALVSIGGSSTETVSLDELKEHLREYSAAFRELSSEVERRQDDFPLSQTCNDLENTWSKLGAMNDKLQEEAEQIATGDLLRALRDDGEFIHRWHLAYSECAQQGSNDSRAAAVLQLEAMSEKRDAFAEVIDSYAGN